MRYPSSMPIAIVLATALIALPPLAPRAAAQANPTNLWSVPLRWVGERLAAGIPVRLTHDTTGSGNSQPSFTPDGRAVIYSSLRGTGDTARSDIFRMDLRSGIETRVTRTPENENSPTVNARGEYVAVRWQPATLFREYGLWVYARHGAPLRGVLPGPDTTGYYAELPGGDYALVRPRERRWTIAIFDARARTITDVDSVVAAVVRPVPGARAVSYVALDSATWRHEIRRYDLATRRVTTIAPVHRSATSHAWAGRNTLLMAQGNELFAWRVGRDRAWRRITTFPYPELRQATVAAVSLQGDRLVLAAPRRASIAVVLEDSLDAGRSADAVATMVLDWQRSGRLDAYNATEGTVLAFGRTALRRRSAADALAIAQLAVRLFPASHRTMAHLGDVQSAGGDREAATASYRRALELNPRTTEADRTAATAVERKLAGPP